MSLLFFDTETQGLPDFNKRARDPAQPHICQLAFMVTDESGHELEFYDQIIRPEGWEIPLELTAIHGISQQKALEVGIPEKLALQTLLGKIKQNKLLVAHNLTFDKFIVRCGLRRFELMTDADDLAWKNLPTFCTMKPMVQVCKLPFPNGGRGFKYPKLQEAFKHAFGKEFDGAHDAKNDLRACKELYFWMRANNIN
jgi:DNA polymerase-3 subunit epsilon